MQRSWLRSRRAKRAFMRGAAAGDANAGATVAKSSTNASSSTPPAGPARGVQSVNAPLERSSPRRNARCQRSSCSSEKAVLRCSTYMSRFLFSSCSLLSVSVQNRIRTWFRFFMSITPMPSSATLRSLSASKLFLPSAVERSMNLSQEATFSSSSSCTFRMASATLMMMGLPWKKKQSHTRSVVSVGSVPTKRHMNHLVVATAIGRSCLRQCAASRGIFSCSSSTSTFWSTSVPIIDSEKYSWRRSSTMVARTQKARSSGMKRSSMAAMKFMLWQ
mmetsp:Transcript_9234/g.37984  ORF Transcript_9234/g.37984 Transcript_9234/m.37984 type:complete len:275 (+) Transcript_9234:470-1294(+)